MNENLFKADASTAFILGNGPSLRDVDLTALPGPTFGMNAAYRYWRTIDWRPTCYSCLDLVVGLSHHEAIAELIEEGRIERFLLRANLIESLGAVARSERVSCLEAIASMEPMLAHPGITTGSHTTLWAAALGHRKLVLAGIDGRYVEVVSGAQKTDAGTLEIIEGAHNPNYFFDGYQSVGDEYNVPNPRPGLHLEAFERAAIELAASDVSVVNANPLSEVPFFPTIDLDRALGLEGSPLGEVRLRPRVVRTAKVLGHSAGDRPSATAAGKLADWLRADRKPLALTALASLSLAALVTVAPVSMVSGRAGELLCVLLFAVLAAALLLVRRLLIGALARLDEHQTGLRHRIDALEHQYKEDKRS